MGRFGNALPVTYGENKTLPGNYQAFIFADFSTIVLRLYAGQQVLKQCLRFPCCEDSDFATVGVVSVAFDVGQSGRSCRA